MTNKQIEIELWKSGDAARYLLREEGTDLWLVNEEWNQGKRYRFTLMRIRKQDASRLGSILARWGDSGWLKDEIS